MRAVTNPGLGRRVDALPGDFQRFELGRRVVYWRRAMAPLAPAIVAGLSTLGASGEGAGNRSSGYRLKLEDGTECIVRINRRGGLMRPFLKDLYLGVGQRPVRELAVADESGRRGIPVAEPIGAMVEWVAPIVYRSMFVTRALAGMTLWEFLCTDDDPLVRAHVIELVRQVIDRIHRLGLLHADLNLNNLFVTKSRESFAIAVLDLDKARLLDGPVPAGMIVRSLARLRRSARKLDPDGRYLDARTLELLTRK
jgi:hypothetical protein